LLVKAGPPQDLPFENGPLPSKIRHAAGPVLDDQSDAYRTLVRWIAAGAPEDLPPPPPRAEPAPGGCSTAVPPGDDTSPVDWSQPGPRLFREVAMPRFVGQCAAGSCHGPATSGARSDLDLFCGDDDAQRAASYHSALALWRSPASHSALLAKPLAGGPYHAGGKIWATSQDPAYQDVKRWLDAEAAPAGSSPPPLELRFAQDVQPLLVQLGCFIAACHGPASPSDLRLSAPAPDGSFTPGKTHRNYLAARSMVNLDASDPFRTRLLAKLLPLGEGGLTHRGGQLLPLKNDPDRDAIALWIAAERGASGASDLLGVAFLRTRPSNESPLDSGIFEQGGDVWYARASGTGASFALGPQVSLTAGVHAASAQLRDPAVRWDGRAVAFAMRAGIDDCLNVYEIDLDPVNPQPAAAARKLTDGSGCLNEEGPHAFMPAYGPDGAIVYSSTRSGGRATNPRRGGFPPQADLWLLPAGGGPTVRLAFGPHDDVGPSYEAPSGRILYSSVKSFGDFFQLAARRINPDGSDLHPLFASRGNLGFEMAFGVRAQVGGAYAATFADRSSQFGAGAIGLLDRSLGPDDVARLADPDPFLFHGFALPVAGASGKGQSAGGAFRDPAPLPDGNLLAACDLASRDLSNPSFPPDYGLCLLDLSNRNAPAPVRRLASVAGSWLIEPVAVQARAPVTPYTLAAHGRDAEGTPGTVAASGPADVVFLDLGPLGSLFEGSSRNGGAGEPGRAVPSPAAVRVLVEPPNPPTIQLNKDTTASGVCPTGGCGENGGLGFGPRAILATVPVEADGSVRLVLPSDRAVSLQLLGDDGLALAVESEAIHFPSGQLHAFSIPRRYFDGTCGACHGALSGKEIDTAIRPDAISGASVVTAAGKAGTDATTGAPAVVTFEENVLPIVTASCATGGCHDVATSAGGLAMRRELVGPWRSAYVALLALADPPDIAAGRTSGCGYDGICRKYIDPHALARRSYLAEVVFDRELDAPFPHHHPKVSLQPGEAELIARWIELGAPYQMP
jgi:hypothetical protein